MHKIIDVHSHLGDIFAYQKNCIYKLNAKWPEDMYNPFEAFSRKGFKGAFLDPTKPEQIENVIKATEVSSHTNTLQYLTRDLDETGVDYVVMMPILPWIGFEDYLAASKLENRILPFTSADFTGDAKEAGKKVVQDAKNGAYGLKIHPILQPVSLRDPKVDTVIRMWEETGKPVISHCGINSYYPENMKHVEQPENGNLEDFMYVVEKYPNINWIAAHAGGLAGGEHEILAKNMAGAPNMWVDTTFRNADVMKDLVRLFGEDKVLFGVDRPFGRTDCSIEQAFEAFGEYTPLSEKVMYSNAAKLLKVN